MIPNYNPYNPYGYEPEIPESAGEDLSDEERLHLMIKRAVVHVLTVRAEVITNQGGVHIHVFLVRFNT
jgi:hypothetical protein